MSFVNRVTYCNPFDDDSETVLNVKRNTTIFKCSYFLDSHGFLQ